MDNVKPCPTCNQNRPVPTTAGLWEYRTYSFGKWQKATTRISDGTEASDVDEGDLLFYPKGSKGPEWWPDAEWRQIDKEGNVISCTDTERLDFLEAALKLKGEVDPGLSYIDDTNPSDGDYFELQLHNSLFTETNLRDAIDRAILAKRKAQKHKESLPIHIFPYTDR